MKTRKRVTALLLCMGMFVLTFTQIPAFAATETPYQNWKQYDAQWANVTMQSNTIKSKGCLATAVAMLVVRSGLKTENNFDPGTFVKQMNQIGGFASNNNLLWEKVTELIPQFALVSERVNLTGTQAQKIKSIKSYYDQGYYVLIAVKNERHWVALDQVSGTAVAIFDPGSTATELFEKYPASGCTRLALFSAPHPANRSALQSSESKSTDPIDILGGTFKILFEILLIMFQSLLTL
ncbi:MAG: hypothetical protein LBB67_00995 [Oscillospiraceae bacterium]|jgi:hypothetical protein|nr:hypothetical protein [Oscillospiraceae bacterium]